MQKSMSIILILIAAALAVAEPQTTCPVMGGKINKAQYADVKEYRIYVCCKPCVAKVKADPQKYIDLLKAAGIEPEKVPGK